MKWNLRNTRTPGTRRTLAGALVLLLALGLLVASAIPALGVSTEPGHVFWGVATVDGVPAADGILVEAKINGATMTSEYVGGGTPGQYWLMVPKEDIQTTEKDGGVQGDTINFYVGGAWAGSYIFFNPDDSTTGYEMNTRVDLAVTDGQTETYTLTVTSSGCCSITVEDPSVVIGTVAAGETDDFVLDETTVVTLTANCNATCRFDGWTVDGSAATDNPTTVTMDADHTVVAYCTTVEPAVTYDLTVESMGCCTVTVEDPYVVIGTVAADDTDTFTLPENTVVTLTANCNTTCQFDGWTVDGADSTDNPATVTMDADHTVVAYCTTVEPPVTYELTVTSVGCCPVSVTWGDDCSEMVAYGTTEILEFAEGAVVTLTAETGPCCEFDSWNLDAVGVYTNPVTVTMDADHVITLYCETTGSSIGRFYLKQGWNTFSMPIQPDEDLDTWGEMIDYNGLDVELFLSYDAVTQSWVPGQLTTLIQPLDGYYVYVNVAAWVEIIPSTEVSAPPMKALQPGLNLVGPATLENPITVYSFLYIADWEVALSPYFNFTDWSVVMSTETYTDTPMVWVGQAYWVYMENPGSLLGYTMTPFY